MEEQLTFENFLDARLPSGGWQRDFNDPKFVERYLKAYLTLFKMQYDEMRGIAKNMEAQQKKTQKATNQLLSEIKRLNGSLTELVYRQEQFAYDFKGLKIRNEAVLKKIDAEKGKAGKGKCNAVAS